MRQTSCGAVCTSDSIYASPWTTETCTGMRIAGMQLAAVNKYRASPAGMNCESRGLTPCGLTQVNFVDPVTVVFLEETKHLYSDVHHNEL